MSLVIELLQIHVISGWRKQVPKRVLIKYSSYHFADPETELDPRVPRISKLTTTQPRPQGLLLDDVQNGGSSGEGPGKG